MYTDNPHLLLKAIVAGIITILAFATFFYLKYPEMFYTPPNGSNTDIAVVTNTQPEIYQPPDQNLEPNPPITTQSAPSTAPIGCYYQSVQCVQAPCNPILVCSDSPQPKITPTPAPIYTPPTATPTPTPSPTSTPEPTVTPTPTPTITPAPDVTSTPTPFPTATPAPTDSNTLTPSPIVIAMEPTPSPTIEQSLRSLDLNGDGKVNIYDYQIMINFFGLTSSGQVEVADIDNSGTIDIGDYTLLIAQLQAGSPV